MCLSAKCTRVKNTPMHSSSSWTRWHWTQRKLTLPSWCCALTNTGTPDLWGLHDTGGWTYCVRRGPQPGQADGEFTAPQKDGRYVRERYRQQPVLVEMLLTAPFLANRRITQYHLRFALFFVCTCYCPLGCTFIVTTLTRTLKAFCTLIFNPNVHYI